MEASASDINKMWNLAQAGANTSKNKIFFMNYSNTTRAVFIIIGCIAIFSCQDNPSMQNAKQIEEKIVFLEAQVEELSKELERKNEVINEKDALITALQNDLYKNADRKGQSSAQKISGTDAMRIVREDLYQENKHCFDDGKLTILETNFKELSVYGYIVYVTYSFRGYFDEVEKGTNQYRIEISGDGQSYSLKFIGGTSLHSICL